MRKAGPAILGLVNPVACAAKEMSQCHPLDGRVIHQENTNLFRWERRAEIRLSNRIHAVNYQLGVHHSATAKVAKAVCPAKLM